MSIRFWRIGILALGFGFASAAVAGETVEDVSKKIAAASAKLKSFTAKSTTVTETRQEGFSMVSTTKGTTEMLRKGADFLVRTESQTAMETTIGGNTTKQTTSMLMINDGSYTYTLSETAGMKSAYKTKMEKSEADPFKAWQANSELKVLPDSTLDGHEVWVIEATPKGNQTAQGKTVIYYQKDSGQMIKMVTYAPDGKPTMTTTCDDIKINGEVSPDRFVFKAPPGVDVQDMSK